MTSVTEITLQDEKEFIDEHFMWKCPICKDIDHGWQTSSEDERYVELRVDNIKKLEADEKQEDEFRYYLHFLPVMCATCGTTFFVLRKRIVDWVTDKRKNNKLKLVKINDR